MKRNVGNSDRVVRTVLGTGAVLWAASLGWTTPGAIVLLAVAAVLLVTAAIGFCPLYRLLGISTTPRNARVHPDRAERLARG